MTEQKEIRCYCHCHKYPGVYRTDPCGVCNHINEKGKIVNGFQGFWTMDNL